MKFTKTAMEAGQGVCEYTLIICLIVIAVIVVITILFNQISTFFSQVSSVLGL